jgi:hypothetical protein
MIESWLQRTAVLMRLAISFAGDRALILSSALRSSSLRPVMLAPLLLQVFHPVAELEPIPVVRG